MTVLPHRRAPGPSSPSSRRRRLQAVSAAAALPVLVALVAVPASGSSAAAAPELSHVSSAVAARYLLEHPEEGGEGPRGKIDAATLARIKASSPTPDDSPAAAPDGLVRFNRDNLGLPQNEESVTVCPERPEVVLSGTNDYRGILNPRGNFTGWHLSTNGGRSLTNEGLLPTVRIAGRNVPSGGDPVSVAGPGCSLYAASLNYDPSDPFGKPSGLGVYKTTPGTLAGCPGGDAPSCWPTRRAVATVRPPEFLDKEWMDVGRSGSAGVVVWTVYSVFTFDPETPLGFSGARIFAVRCDADLEGCTKPILISGADKDVQFGDVNVGPDGRVYLTWAEIQGELEQTAQTFIIKMRVAPAGSTDFGPTRVVDRVTKAIPFGGKLNANDFRVATLPKSDVSMVNGKPRAWVVWDECSARVLDFVCEDAQIKLRHSDDLGATWSPPRVVSTGGQNYFPALEADDRSGRLAVTYFTHRYDRVFDSRQDVELVTLSADGAVTKRQRVTPFSNEPEADPLLGGRFIGDYIDVAVHNGTAYIAFNANYVKRRLLGEGLPIAQQDNFLAVRRM